MHNNISMVGLAERFLKLGYTVPSKLLIIEQGSVLLSCFGTIKYNVYK